MKRTNPFLHAIPSGPYIVTTTTNDEDHPTLLMQQQGMDADQLEVEVEALVKELEKQGFDVETLFPEITNAAEGRAPHLLSSFKVWTDALGNELNTLGNDLHIMGNEHSALTEQAEELSATTRANLQRRTTERVKTGELTAHLQKLRDELSETNATNRALQNELLKTASAPASAALTHAPRRATTDPENKQ
ncbi:hypothetical protein BC567DRAFT_299657 [Phyllosticta citribraziliensis]